MGFFSGVRCEKHNAENFLLLTFEEDHSFFVQDPAYRSPVPLFYHDSTRDIEANPVEVHLLMASSSPETAPPGDNDYADSPPDDSSSSSSPPPSQSPPEAPPQSPPQAPPQSPPQAPPQSPPPSTPTPPSPSSPSADSSPPQPSDAPPASPPPSATPSLSPPPTEAGSPPSPSNSEQPPSTLLSPPPTIFSPPSPDAGSSRTPPFPVLSPSPPRSSSDSGSSGSSPMPISPSPSSGDGVNVSVVAGIVGGVVAIIALIIACIVCSRRKKKQPYYTDHGQPPKGGPVKQNHPSATDHVVKLHPQPGTMGTPSSGWGAPPGVHSSSEFSSNNSGQHPFPMQSASPNVGGYGGKSQFSFEELSAATGGFAQENVLGQGGFGYVHKGVFPDGKEVAVKSLKSGSGQGDREFQAEVDIISRVHHRHLVTLVGYCMAGDKRILVYEFIPNKTLEFHLHGKGQTVMTWASRIRIAIGSAKGLAYLHEDCEPRIIHRDIKAANILLDFNFEAKVADFGLAKLTSDNFTHVSTRVMGTFGYLAPEYAASGKLSEKSDVFSFGVMLLELITGRRPVDPTNTIMEDSLVDWARPLMSVALETGIYDKVVDPRLEDNYTEHEMACMVACASACVRHSARRRPRMSQVVRTLEGASSLDDLNEHTKAGQSVALNTSTRDIYDTRAYNADIMKFKQMIQPNQEFNSSESGGTSEFGLNPSSSSTDSRDMDMPSPRKREL